MQVMVCPFHGDEDCAGVHLGEGVFMYRCSRTSNHPNSEPYEWSYSPESPTDGLDGIAAELGLGMLLPSAVAALGAGWFEYGLVERRFALDNPSEWAVLVQRYGHRYSNEEPVKYTASAFLAHILGALARSHAVALRDGPATGRWSYNSTISYWATQPEANWAERVTWESVDPPMDYLPVPGEFDRTVVP